MRKIDGPWAVGNAFVDYDAVTNPNGTVYTADYGNDVQDELVGIQDEFSIAEAAGTNKYVLAAIKGIAIKLGKQLGEMFYMDSVKLPAEFDKDNPEDFFPGLCLDTIDSYTDISSTNWPDLVAHLRAKALTYNEGISGQKSTFSVTDWDITSNVATLTFANTTAENAILDALSEDNLVHGSYANWRSITLSGAIGDISAGEYALTDVDPLTRTVSFAFVAGNNSGSGSFTSSFYTNRVPGSATTARVYEATGRTLVSANGSDSDYINGLRKRDAMQRITGSLDGAGAANRGAFTDGTETGVFVSLSTGKFSSPGASTGAIDELGFDSSLSTSPNTAKTDDAETRAKSAIGHIYLWGQEYLVP